MPFINLVEGSAPIWLYNFGKWFLQCSCRHVYRESIQTRQQSF